MKPISLLLFLFIALSINTFGQEYEEYFRHIDIEDGLTGNYVNKIIEDQYGFIWIACNNGLNKFDGVNITSYRKNALDKGSIPSGQVYDIYELSSGEILVAASKMALFSPISGNFKTLNFSKKLPEFQAGTSIQIDSNDNFWIGSRTGLYHILDQDLRRDTLNAEYYSFRNDIENPDWIRCMAIQGEKLWIGTISDGLYQFNTQKKTFLKIDSLKSEIMELLASAIWEILVDSGNNLWISTFNGLLFWESGAEEPEIVTSVGEGITVPNAGIQSLIEDSNGYIWIGTGLAGAIGYNPESGDVIEYRSNGDDKKSLAEDDVHYIYPDEKGNMWFGYHVEGLSYMSKEQKKYSYHLPAEEAGIDSPLNSVLSYLEDEDGNMWFGSDLGLVFNSENGEIVENYIPFPDRVRSDRNANTINDMIWHGEKIVFTTEGGELGVFETDNKSFRELPTEKDVSRMWGAFEDDKNFYFGSLEYGMYLLSKKDYNVIYFPNPENDPEKDKKSMHPFTDIEGNVYVNSFNINIQDANEYYAFDPETYTFTYLYTLPEDIRIYGPSCVSATTPGVVFHPTEASITKVDMLNKTTTNYFSQELANANINLFGLLEDTDGTIYFSANDFFGRSDPVIGDFSIIQGFEGERPLQYNIPSLMKNGDLLVSGRGGYICINPENIAYQKEKLTPYIKQVRFNDQLYAPLYEDYKVSFPHNTSVFISYSAIYFKDPSEIKFRYKLPGFQDDWVELGRQQQVFFSNLSPGEYTFQLQASLNTQGYGDDFAELSFTVLPPWYKTNLAYVSYVFLFIGLIVLIDRIQRKRIITKEREKAREKELEQAKEIEKAYKELKSTQSQLIQSEKMASLGELTAGIAHEIQNPLNFVNNFSDVTIDLIDELDEEMKNGNLDEVELIKQDLKSNLEKIHHHGQRASSIVKGMLSHSRMGNHEKELADINVLADEYLRLAYHGLRAKDKSFNAEYQTDLDESLPKIKVVGQDIGRVFLNIINNAFYAVSQKAKKVADYAPKVSVQTKANGNNIEIRIKDNADGIPGSVLEKIFQPFFTTKPSGHGTGLGLSLSYDIIEKGHNGKLEVKTQEGVGTEFIIELPI